MLRTKFLLLCILLPLISIITPSKVIAHDAHTGTQFVKVQRQDIILSAQAAEITLANLAATKQDSEQLKAGTTISEEALRDYLILKHSPLAPYAGLILKSPYWSTIIGICTIEQYNCSRAPNWNYWGLMKKTGGLQSFATAEESINAISNYLQKVSDGGRTTIPSLAGYYCVNHDYPGGVCPGWVQTVSSTKIMLEQYGQN